THLFGDGHFKVCDVGFFAARKTAYADLVQGKEICAVSYSYVRDISKDDYAPRWLQKLLDGGLAKDKATALVKLLPAANINNGDVLELLWYPTKTFIVRYNGKESGRLTDDETAIAVIVGLLGP